MEVINNIAKRYYKYSLWLIFGLTVVILIVMQYFQDTSLVGALSISALFSLISGIAYIQSWKAVAKRSTASLGKFYIAASALRMLSARGCRYCHGRHEGRQELALRVHGNVCGFLLSDVSLRLRLLLPNREKE